MVLVVWHACSHDAMQAQQWEGTEEQGVVRVGDGGVMGVPWEVERLQAHRQTHFLHH